jgi:hypothetical protein
MRPQNGVGNGPYSSGLWSLLYRHAIYSHELTTITGKLKNNPSQTSTATKEARNEVHLVNY